MFVVRKQGENNWKFRKISIIYFMIQRRKQMDTHTEKKGLNISAASFVAALIILLVLMILTYGLTFVIPGGEIPFWKWLLSPVMVLGAEGSGSLIAVIVFLLVIGGIFNSLDKCGLMKYMLDRITARFGNNRYRLMYLIVLFFMAMGSFIGSFEECVPLVPIVVALSLRMGWDALVGMGMSILAAGCGFAAGICNPFTVGVAQELAGLPMFSGMGLRAGCFVLIYLLLTGFLRTYAAKADRGISRESEQERFHADRKMDRGLICFSVIVGCGIALVLSSAVITALQDYTMIIVAVVFLAAGVSSVLVSGMSGRRLGSTFWNGLLSVLPAVLMILMANSIKYTLVEADILDTILHAAVEFAGGLARWQVLLFIYLIVLVMNFFIPSGSAKAFLLIPLIIPLAQSFGVNEQLCILAFAFGDGFSNVFYPTNPVLLISLGLADISYGKWVRFSGRFQLWNLLLTSGLLLAALAIF